MEKLTQGALKFMDKDFYEYKELFESLGKKQNPHTIFISCVDSRIVPSLITNTKPGELYSIRNIANIIPPYRVSNEFLATTSSIEYALSLPETRNIIICGHSNCGGCNALFQERSEIKTTPNFNKWIDLLKPIKDNVLKIEKTNKARQMWLTERLNIINSVQNLLTYPTVIQKVQQEEITISGWHYIIEIGKIYNYDLKEKHLN